MVTTSELRMKEVINIVTGKRLGFIDDLDINLENNRVEAIIVPKEGKLLKLFSRDNSYIIPWKRIVKIGEDVILVDLKDYNEYEEYVKDDFNSSETFYNEMDK